LPTLRVGASLDRAAVRVDAERPGLRSHAERGNDNASGGASRFAPIQSPQHIGRGLLGRGDALGHLDRGIADQGAEFAGFDLGEKNFPG
jgi:hypothetical protein